MTEKHDIRRLQYENVQSIIQIARQTGHDRKTIRISEASGDEKVWMAHIEDSRRYRDV